MSIASKISRLRASLPPWLQTAQQRENVTRAAAHQEALRKEAQDLHEVLGSQIERFDQLSKHFHQQVRAMRAAVGMPARQKPAEEYSRHFWPWLESLTTGGNPIRDRRAWITFGAADALDGILKPDMRVFEYGAGGSTLYFSQRVCELVTVEHDEAWMQQTKQAMAKVGSVRWTPFVAPPAEPKTPITLPPSDPLSYASSDESLGRYSFEAYAKVIDQFEDGYFDLISIDGRARPACFMHALKKVKAGGYIMLDNAEREVYGWIEEAALARKFSIQDYWGAGPYNLDFWRTILLQKQPVRYYGLNDLDAKLEQYLDFDNGVFIEAGANDGIRQSNTLFFEESRNWRGLLVEPTPAQAQRCRANRRKAIIEEVALVPAGQSGKPVTLRFADLMSVVKGGMRSQEEEDAHIAAGCDVQQLETFEFEAATATLSELIDKHALHKVDLLSLDVEGFEADVLAGLDMSRHRPRFILVEARDPEAVTSMLAPHYEFVDKLSHHDLLFRAKQP